MLSTPSIKPTITSPNTPLQPENAGQMPKPKKKFFSFGVLMTVLVMGILLIGVYDATLLVRMNQDNRQQAQIAGCTNVCTGGANAGFAFQTCPATFCADGNPGSCAGAAVDLGCYRTGGPGSGGTCTQWVRYACPNTFDGSNCLENQTFVSSNSEFISPYCGSQQIDCYTAPKSGGGTQFVGKIDRSGCNVTPPPTAPPTTPPTGGCTENKCYGEWANTCCNSLSEGSHCQHTWDEGYYAACHPATPPPQPSPTPTPRVSPSPTPTPRVSPSPTPTPTPTPTPSVTPSPSPTPTPGVTPSPSPQVNCNEDCTSNADCANSSHVCFEGHCRLPESPYSESCTVTPTPTPTAPVDVPQELPRSGSNSLRDWVMAGLGILGVGAVLLLIL